MKHFSLILVMALAALLSAESADAATTDTITVTVSLQTVISVTVTPDTWTIGAIALSSTVGPESFSASVGNTATKLEIKATDGAGGWSLGGTPSLDQFSVTVASPPLTLTTTNQTLAASVAANGSVGFDLTYAAPLSDSQGAGTAQGFTITLTASAP